MSLIVDYFITCSEQIASAQSLHLSRLTMSTAPPHLISRIKPVRIATLQHIRVRPAVGSAAPRHAPKQTVVKTLGAKLGPMNLRIEEFRDAKRDWSGIKSETRDALKRVLKER
ncbi:unnamed protein product [Rhizoctonia solani]|uniref:Uncharacterized protein n=1 Tax=Rhizoctonia solani TaxID=456999 RepID=A0A8H3GGK1_9AGAM|nr:unnamed protein product [Rhizoctonia solani]